MKGILCVRDVVMKEDTELNIVRMVKLGDLLNLKIDIVREYNY